MPYVPRAEILDRLRTKIAERRPIVGAGAGTGLSAKCEEDGGADLIVIYNSGRYRMAGRGSLSGLLAYGNANDLVVEMGREVLPITKRTPVLAGVNGTDPFYNPTLFLRQLKEQGFSGSRTSRPSASSTARSGRTSKRPGMSYQLEVELDRQRPRARPAHDPVRVLVGGRDQHDEGGR